MTTANGNPSATPDAAAGESPARQILRSLLIVGVCGVFLRFGGLIVSMAISHTWTPDAPESSAYNFLFGTLITTFIYPSLLNLFRPAFIPLYNQIRKEQGPEAAVTFAQGVLEIGMLLGLAVFGVIWFLPDLTVHVMAPRFTADQHAASVHMMHWMAPGILCLLVAEMYLIIFHAERRFAYPHSAEALQKIAWGVGIVVAVKVLGWRNDVIGVTYSLGCLLQLALTAYGMYRTFGWLFRRINLRLWLQRWGKPAGLITLPLAIGIGGALVRDYGTHWLQTALDNVGYVSVGYARQLTNLPKAFLGQIISMVMLPHLAALLHSHGAASHRRTIEGTIETIWLLSIPVTAIILILAPELMALIFIKAEWTEAHFLLCDKGALAMRMIALGFTFVVLESVLMPGLFSIQSMWWPTLWGLAAAGFQILCLGGLVVAGLPRDSAWLLAGVAFAYPLSRIFKNGVLLVVLRHKTGIFPGTTFVTFLAKMAGLLLACLALTYLARSAFRPLLGGIPTTVSQPYTVNLAALHFAIPGWAAYKLRLLAQIGLPSAVTLAGFLALTLLVGYKQRLQEAFKDLRHRKKGETVVVPE